MCGKYTAYRIGKGNGWDMTGAGFVITRSRNGLKADESYATAIRLAPYDPAIMGAVTVFSLENCEGLSNGFFWNPDDPLEGWYTQDDFKDIRGLLTGYI